MPRFLLSILCLLCFMNAETQAKVRVHRETVHEDREQARLELDALQKSSPAAGEVRIMKMQIRTGQVEQMTLHSSQTLPAEDTQRVAYILQQLRLNPDYMRRTGGHKRVGRWIRYSAPKLFLSFNGEWKEINIYAITATKEDSKRWLLEENLLKELHSIVERNAPKQPNEK